MRKVLVKLLVILMVVGMVSSAYAEKLWKDMQYNEIAERAKSRGKSLSFTVDKATWKSGKAKIENYGREVKILDSKGMPVTITDEKGKPVNLIVGSKGNLVVQKHMAIEKEGVKNRSIKQDIIKLEKPTIARPAKPEKPTLQGIFRPGKP
jgi:hypothetical protein